MGGIGPSATARNGICQRWTASSITGWSGERPNLRSKLPGSRRERKVGSWISVAADAGKVKQIAERAGWHCVTCNRGPFHVIEVWVENDTMVEVLPPDFAAEYLAWTSPDTVATRMTSAPSSAARHARARSS